MPELHEIEKAEHDHCTDIRADTKWRESERHVEIMTVLIEIRDELRKQNAGGQVGVEVKIPRMPTNTAEADAVLREEADLQEMKSA